MQQISMWRRVIVGTILAVSLSYAHAADVNGRIKGTITDAAGAVVPNVTVVATNEATGVQLKTVSQANGDYQFQQVPVGTYTVSATATGFKSFSAKGIVINIDKDYVEKIELSVGSTSDTIQVEANPVQVNTTDMQLSNIVDASQIVAYPLIGRAFTQLELILPGVQASSDRFTSAYSVNGAQTQQSSYLINGADTNDFALNTIGIQPNEDALDQFNMITGPLNSEYSRNSGAIVSAVVKNGTNQFHGDAFWFYRDTFLNTANFFQYNAQTGKKVVPVFHQNLFGGTLGGPILKDKLFFFIAYQGNRARQPATGGNSLVPTNAQRGGDFSANTAVTAASAAHVIPGTVAVPGCTGLTYGACFGFVPNSPTSTSGHYTKPLSTNAFNKVSSGLLNAYVPPPNSGTNRYVFNSATNLIQDQGIINLAYNPTIKNQINFIGVFQHAPTVDTLPFSGPTLPGFGDQSTSEIHQFTTQYVHQFSATALNSFALHYTRFNFGSVVPQKVVAPSTAGFAINPQNTAGQSLPLVALTGNFSIGFSTNGPQPRIDQTYQVDDSFSKSLGHHELKFGYDGRQFTVDQIFSGSNNGVFAFTSSSSNPNTSGDVVLDFLLGVPSTYGQGAGGRISARSYENYIFAQDTWKAASNLTISYGLGYQIDTAIHNRQYGGEGVNCFVSGQQSKIFPTAPLSLNFPGDPGCNDAQGATIPWKDFGPRIGFAYSPDLGFLSGGADHKLSIRGGFGIYYNRTEQEGSLQNLSQVPYGITSAGIRDSSTAFRPSFANPYQDVRSGTTITNPFPAAFPQPGATNVVFPGTPLGISQYSPGYRAPYAENFQLSIERELPGRIVATASYVGSVARHNQITTEGNPVTPAGHALCLADQTCIDNAGDQEVLYPSHTLHPQAINPATGQTHFASASQIVTGGSSNFNALELSLKKGVTHGLAGQVSYTYGHALDNASSYEGAGFGTERGYNQYQTSLNYGNSDYDARHRLVIAPIYQVPYTSSGSIFSPRNLLLSGWQISGIVTFATGHPFDIAYNGFESYALYCSANQFYYTCPDVPNQVAPLKMTNPHNVNSATKGRLFDGTILEPGAPNTGASFAEENYFADGVFGNISRNKYSGPGIDNTDMQISKNFRYSQDNAVRVIQLRLESYNVFNHTNFKNPGGNPDSAGSFGVITSAASGRSTQLSGKIYF
jgi:hypothetical protein